jgi:hypothetical protein
MKIEPIPGFSALKFKEEAQASVQAELEGLTPEERICRIRESVENGPLGNWWKQLRANQPAEAKAALERDEQQNAA